MYSSLKEYWQRIANIYIWKRKNERFKVWEDSKDGILILNCIIVQAVYCDNQMYKIPKSKNINQRRSRLKYFIDIYGIKKDKEKKNLNGYNKRQCLIQNFPPKQIKSGDFIIIFTVKCLLVHFSTLSVEKTR